MHAYYMKGRYVLDMEVHVDASFLFKKILKYITEVLSIDSWCRHLTLSHYTVKTIYSQLRPPIVRISWRELVLNNIATPGTKFILWLALWGRLATKDRLLQFDVRVDPVCVSCEQCHESMDHLFFS